MLDIAAILVGFREDWSAGWLVSWLGRMMCLCLIAVYIRGFGAVLSEGIDATCRIIGSTTMGEQVMAIGMPL